MSEKKNDGADKLKALAIKRDFGVVGDFLVHLRTPTMAMQEAIVDVISKLDPRALFVAAQPIIEAWGTPGFGEKVVQGGGDVYTALVDLVLRGGTQTLRQAAAILCDNVETFNAIRESQKFEDADVTREGARYLSSDKLRTVIAGEVTAEQAVDIFITCVKLGSYGNLGKAVMGLLGQAQAAKGKTSPKTVILDS